MINLTKTSNPALSEKIFDKQISASYQAMTVNGTVNKTALMLLLVVAAAIYTWNKFFGIPDTESAMPVILPWMAVGGIGGLITALVTVFRPRSSGITAPIYAVFEGLLLGALSAVFEAMYPGIVVRAVALTLGVFLAMLFLYRSGVIKVTRKFIMGVVAATAGVALIYFVSFIAGLFGASLEFLYGSSTFGIGFSLVVVAIAALNLVLDFSFIEHTARSGAPKYMEWYGAFGLMVTLIWLYIEILRLLARLANRE